MNGDVSQDDRRADLHAVARGGTLNVAGSVVNFVFGVALVIVVSRTLNARGAGIFFEAVALFSILASAAQLGASTGLVRTISRFLVLGRTDDLRSTIFVAIVPVLAIGTIYAIAVWTLAPRIVDVFFHGVHPEDGAAYLRLLAPLIPLTAATIVALSGTRGFGTMLPYVAVEQIGKPFLRPILVVIAVALGLGEAGVIIAWGIPLAIGFPVALNSLRTLLRRTLQRAGPSHAPPQPRPLGVLAREFWAFAAPRGVATLFQISLVWLDTLIVGAIAGVAAAGMYAAASRFALVGLLALEAVRLAIAPRLSALLAAGDHERVHHLYQVGTWWIMLPSWPFYLTLAVFSPVLLGVLGAEFVAANPALLVLSLAMLVSMAAGNVTVVLLMGGKSWWNLTNVGIALVVNVVLNLLLVPRLGITGAALAWAASILLENLIPLVQIAVHFRFHPFGRGYLLVAGAAIGCYGVLGLAMRALMGATPIALGVTLVLGTALYSRIMWRSRELLELTTFWKAIRSRMNGRRGAGEVPFQERS